MKHYGDVSALDGAKIEPVDIITFWQPMPGHEHCGQASWTGWLPLNLFYEAIRIVKEMRCTTDERYPRYIVWENVPGAFSSNGGEDFKAVLEAVCSVKGGETDIARPAKWPNAGEIWQTVTQSHGGYLMLNTGGVPQRRKRIYLVADFDGGSAGKYYLSQKACLGILRRASARGKTLPSCWRRLCADRHLPKRPGRKPHGHHRGRDLHSPCRSASSSLRDGFCRILHGTL